MKVADIMRTSLITVSEETPIKEIARLIFSLGIAGIPVVRQKKLVGIVTEQDILAKLFPSIRDLIEDYTRATDFDLMERNLVNLLETPAAKIMNREVKTITPDTPLMRAQSVMLINKFSRIPIVDQNKNLVGIVSQGDIFRKILKDEIPKLEKERYAGFIAKYYDQMINWKRRLRYEFPPLFKLFRQEGVKTILDLGVWTGEYTINMARKWPYKILGVDHNSIMIKICQEKKEKLSSPLKERLDFILSDFTDLNQRISERFDGAICMGNSLPYLPISLGKLFRELSLVLREKNAVLVLQILNLEKVLKTKKRLLSFIIQKSQSSTEKEHLFVEFFDPAKGERLSHHLILFDSDGKNWIFKGLTTIPIRYLKKPGLERTLREAGFSQISFAGNMGEYQGEFGQLSFDQPFKPLESDFLNVVAKK